MNEQMKILLAYDGSNYADAAIDDLRFAGLPPHGEALIVSVADVSEDSSETICETGVLGRYVSTRILEETLALAHKEKASARNAAIELAKRGGKRILSNLPGWRVRNQIGAGNPAEELLKKTYEFLPQLIVVGSHGRSALGRFFLGSVSHEVAEKAACSVRIVRHGFQKNRNAPHKIILGASSLPDAEELIEAIDARRWSKDAEMRLVVADEGISAGRVSAVYPRAKATFEQAVERLRANGAKVSVDIKSGVTESVLLAEAADWKADSIFVVNEKAFEEKGLGNLAASLITGAKCTIEIIK